MLDLIRRGKNLKSVTSVTLVNNVTKAIDLTVPSGKKWVVMGFTANNPDNVQRAFSAVVYKEAAKTNLLRYLKSLAGAAFIAGARTQWPTNGVSDTIQRGNQAPFLLLNESNTIQFQWPAGGASAGGTDADGLILEYLEIDE